MSDPGIEDRYQLLAAELRQVRAFVASRFLTVKEVCARYGWSPRTFYRRKLAPTFPRATPFPGRAWRLADLIAAELVGHLPAIPDMDKCPTAGRI